MSEVEWMKHMVEICPEGELLPSDRAAAISQVSRPTLGNFALFLLMAMAHLMKLTFLGRLRESEGKRPAERGTDTVTETCIGRGLTISREELNVPSPPLLRLPRYCQSILLTGPGTCRASSERYSAITLHQCSHHLLQCPPRQR
jgi:hypothetical protein